MRPVAICLACLMSASCASPAPSERTATQGVAQDGEALFAVAGFTKPREKDKGCIGRHVTLPTGVVFTGSVAVKFLVRSDGTVERYERLTEMSDGQAPKGTLQRFDDRLRAAIRSCAFEPGRDAQGIPRNIWMVLPLQFARP
jgi:hypothetical protein